MVSNSENAREKKARRLANTDRVNRVGSGFHVGSLDKNTRDGYVSRNDDGVIVCDCREFSKALLFDAGFRCEHIMAVKFAIATKNTEPLARSSKEKRAEVSHPSHVSQVSHVSHPENGTSKTESRKSERGEQEPETVSKAVFDDRQIKNVGLETFRFDTTKEKNEMKQNKLAAATVDETPSVVETSDNILDFSTTLRELRSHLDPNLVRKREGWRDRNGNSRTVEYIEWHTVADILDETAPNWSHTVKDIRKIGDFTTVTVAITIDGVTREGIGTGASSSEMGIKKAEHDALKRAAVKFGIARDLYKREFDAFDRGDTADEDKPEFPADPVAQRLSDLVTTKQLGMIRAIAREKLVDADNECFAVMKCKAGELTRRAASAFIDHLQDLQSPVPVQMPLKRAS
jgi:hypothetical protein